MNEWQPFNGTFRDFDDAGHCKPGVQVRTADGAELLIGHINEQGGICDDCKELYGDDLIVAWRVVIKLSSVFGG